MFILCIKCERKSNSFQNANLEAENGSVKRETKCIRIDDWYICIAYGWHVLMSKQQKNLQMDLQ